MYAFICSRCGEQPTEDAAVDGMQVDVCANCVTTSSTAVRIADVRD